MTVAEWWERGALVRFIAALREDQYRREPDGDRIRRELRELDEEDGFYDDLS
jgi:hypothetical protein